MEAFLLSLKVVNFVLQILEVLGLRTIEKLVVNLLSYIKYTVDDRLREKSTDILKVCL